MVTALTAGKIYLLESDSGNQEWLHDPETIDLDNFTEGTDYIVINLSDNWQKNTMVERNVVDFPGGGAYDVSLEMRYDEFRVKILEPTRATVRLVEKFFDLHTKSSDNAIYLVVKHGSNDYEEFTDDTRTRREYLACVLVSPFKRSFAAADRYHDIELRCRGVW